MDCKILVAKVAYVYCARPVLCILMGGSPSDAQWGISSGNDSNARLEPSTE